MSACHLFLLFPKVQGPFCCFCNLLPELKQPSWLTATAHFFYLCDFLNKLCLVFEFLGSEFFNQTGELRLLNRGPTPGAVCHQQNAMRMMIQEGSKRLLGMGISERQRLSLYPPSWNSSKVILEKVVVEYCLCYIEISLSSQKV